MNTERDRRYRSEGTGGFDIKDFKSIGDNVVFEMGVLVFHPEKISIGRNVYVGHNTILKGYYKNEFIIGDHTWIGQGCFLPQRRRHKNREGRGYRPHGQDYILFPPVR